MRRKRAVGLGVVGALVILSGGLALRGEDKAAPADAGLTRARKQVKMLDDLYKNAVVSITGIYKDGPPAVKVAKDLFAAMEKAGHHSARLVDATGSPLNEANLPKSDFEHRAVEAIKAGKAQYEEVGGTGDRRVLQVATVVPAVLPRCAGCHGVKEGDLLGFLRYELPIE